METKPYHRGKRLRELRTNKKLTLQKVAAKVSATKATVSKWETNADVAMSIAAFFKLADLYDADPRELATGKHGKGAPLPPQRLALINALSSLPPDVREPIEALIQSLSLAFNPRYQEWSAKEAARAQARDQIHEASK